MLINAKYLGRVSALAVALGIGAAVANTPGFAVAEPSDSGSSSDSSSSSSATGSSSDSASDMSSTGSTPSAGSSAAAPGSSVDATSGVGQGSVDGQSGSTSSVGDPSTADPRSGVVQSSGGAHTSSASASGDPTASAGATSTPTASAPSGSAGTASPSVPPAAAAAGQAADATPSVEPEPSPVAGQGPGDPGRRRGHPDPEGAPRRGASGAEFRGQRPTESVRVGGCTGGDPAGHGGGAGRCDPPAARATADRSTARRGQHHGGVGARRLLGRVARCWWGAGGSRRGRWCVGAAERRGPGVVQCAGMGGARSGCLR